MRRFAVLLIFFQFITLVSPLDGFTEVRDRAKDRETYKKDDDVLDQYEKLRGEVVISKKYRAGRYLLYDCEDRHFACADEISYKLCKIYRQEDKDRKKELLSCGPLKKYETAEECHQAIYTFVHRIVPKDFCMNITDFLKKF